MCLPSKLSRREVIAGAGGAVALIASRGLRPAQARADHPESSLLLSAPLTHSDRMLRPGAQWGVEGIRRMLDTCKATGWKRVHWRVFDGGRALYRSNLMAPQGKWEEDNYHRHHGNLEVLRNVESLDYSQLDTLAEAVRYGHEIGLEIYAWATINEDDHGWGIRSLFAIAHPECCWRKRNGDSYRSQLSFAFPEVMQYKLGLVEELLAGYAIDGLFLDWIRTGDVRDNPQTDPKGVADHGYEQPMLDGFKAKFAADPLEIPNGDPRWVAFRAESHTEFMRGVRKLIERKRPKGLPVSVLVGHPWLYRGAKDRIDGNLAGLLLDVTAWAREGLIDEVVPAGYFRDGGNAELACQALKEETLGKTPVVLYAWVPGSVDEFKGNLDVARRVGARQILFWEADYIDGRDAGTKQELQTAMQSYTESSK